MSLQAAAAALALATQVTLATAGLRGAASQNVSLSNASAALGNLSFASMQEVEEQQIMTSENMSSESASDGDDSGPELTPVENLSLAAGAPYWCYYAPWLCPPPQHHHHHHHHHQEQRRRRHQPAPSHHSDHEDHSHHSHHSGRVMTLYHTTSASAAEAILKSGFRPGHSGWCGGAIYFSTTPHLPKSKYGPDTHSGAVLEVKVNLGRLAHLDSKCHGAGGAKHDHDSITFNPGDGDEYVIWSNSRIISKRRYS